MLNGFLNSESLNCAPTNSLPRLTRSPIKYATGPLLGDLYYRLTVKQLRKLGGF